MPAHRVAITGIGCITPLGWSLETTWRELQTAGHLSPQRAAPLDEDHLARHIPHRKALGRMDRRACLALSAAMEAVAHAGLKCEGTSLRRGISVGVGVPDLGIERLASAVHWSHLPPQAGEAELLEALAKALSPRWLLPQLPNMTAAHLAIAFGAQGPVHTSSDAVAGGQALEVAVDLISDGEAEAVIAGEVDASLPVRDLASASRGSLEAAAFFVMEEEGFARNRGARVLALAERAAEVPAPSAAPFPPVRRGDERRLPLPKDKGGGFLPVSEKSCKLLQGAGAARSALQAALGLRGLREAGGAFSLENLRLVCGEGAA